jgi:hypothetical protein
MSDDTHPQYDPDIQTLRTYPEVAQIEWAYDETYKVRFTTDAGMGGQIDTFVARLRDESSFAEVGGPASRSGNSILIQREETPIEINDDTEVTSNE